MISGFLTSVGQFLHHAASISRNVPYVDYWFLTIFYSGFFRQREVFDKRTNRVSTDVADKHAFRYISEIAT